MRPATATGIFLVLVGIVGFFAGIFIFSIGGHPIGIRLAVPIFSVFVVFGGLGLLFAVKRRK